MSEVVIKKRVLEHNDRDEGADKPIIEYEIRRAARCDYLQTKPLRVYLVNMIGGSPYGMVMMRSCKMPYRMKKPIRPSMRYNRN